MTIYDDTGVTKRRVSETTVYDSGAGQRVPGRTPYMGMCGREKEAAPQATPCVGGSKAGVSETTPHVLYNLGAARQG